MPEQNQLKTSTFFSLMAEFGSADIPLERCCEKYFGLNPQQAVKRASVQGLPVPVYKAGSQKSPWLVNAGQLAEHLEKRIQQAEKEWRALNA